MIKNKTVAHVVVNNLGGITSLVQNLILYKGSDALPQELYLLNVVGNMNTPAIIDPELEPYTHSFYIHPLNNWYYTYGKMAKLLSKSEGVLVSNDQYDLIMLQAFNIPRKVVQLVHDPYNVELSSKFHQVIDCFIVHSHYIYEELLQVLPQRKSDIIHLPYGIPIQAPLERSLQEKAPLKLIFLGRHDTAKGVYDLFEINRMLEKNGVFAEWLILGNGPENEGLRQQWKGHPRVKFLTPINNCEVLDIAARADIMVFPTKFEGFPVALLECMSQGCVPVVTDLPGGIQEMVEDGITGFRCKPNDNEQFARSIITLHTNRKMLLQLQMACVRKVHEKFNAKICVPAYQEIFKKLTEDEKVPRHHTVNVKIGSCLDQKWIPHYFTRLLRKI